MSTGAIDLARLDDAAFNRLYKERIEPCFVANEADRQTAVATFQRRTTIGAGVVFALMLGVGLWRDDLGTPLVTGLITGMIAWWIAYQPLAAVGRTLKRQYCGAIAEAMGANFSMEVRDPPALERLKALGMLPAYDRASFEDMFSGDYKASSFSLYEANLVQRRSSGKGRTHYVTVFRGQLIRMPFPRDFLGITIVRRDAGVFNVFGGGKNLERVRLVSSEFERAFEVWSNDQVEARYLLHPVMMERLIELERGLHGKRLRCAFEGGDLLVAVEGGNLFEPGDLFKPLVDPARARRIVDELAGVFKVMDQVLTAQRQN